MAGNTKWKGVPVAVVSAALFLAPVPGQGGARVGASVGFGTAGSRGAAGYGSGGAARGFGGVTGGRGAVDVGSSRVRVELDGKGGTKGHGEAWRERSTGGGERRSHGHPAGGVFFGVGGGLRPGLGPYRGDPLRFRRYRSYPYYRAYPYYRSYPYYPSYPVSPEFRVEPYRGRPYPGTVYGDEGEGSSVYRPDREPARTLGAVEQPLPPGRAHPQVARALDHNAVGESATWVDPSTGSENTVTPTRDLGGDARCREFTHTVTTAGGRVESWGLACLTPEGRWEVDL